MNSWNSMARRASMARLAMPQVKDDSNRHPVSTATVVRSNRSLPAGPPAVAFRWTA